MQTVQVTLSVNLATLAKISAVLNGLDNVEVTPAAEPAKRTRKPKQESFELSGGEKSLDEMDADEQAEVEDEVTETAEDDDAPLTLKAVITACRLNKKAAIKQLAKLKLKSVEQLKPSQYAKFVAALE